MKKKIFIIILFTLFVGVSLFGEIFYFASSSYNFSLTGAFANSIITDHQLYTVSEKDHLGFKLESGFKIGISKNGLLNISAGFFPIIEKYETTVRIANNEFSTTDYKSYNNYFIKLYPEYRWGKDDQFSVYLGFGLNYCDKDEGFTVGKLDSSVYGGLNYIITASKDLNFTIGVEAGYYYLYKNFTFFSIGIGVEKKIF